MPQEFVKGKIIVTVIIGIVLLINGIGLWFTKTWMLHWYVDLLETLTDPAARDAARALETWFVMNQSRFVANQGMNFGIVILLSLMLYLGFNWLRWLWAIHWLARGIVGLFATVVALLYIEQFHRLLVVGLLVSLLYVICGLTMIISPSVRCYMHALRKPVSRPL